jgi:hypothetical protein
MHEHGAIPYHLVKEDNFPTYISGELVSSETLELDSVASDGGTKEFFDGSEAFSHQQLTRRKSNNEELVPVIPTPSEHKSVGRTIRNTLKPTLCGLGTNSVPELGYEIVLSYPGTAAYMDIPFLIWTATVPHLFALSKFIEQRNQNKNLERINWFLEKSDTIFSTMVFNLETLSSIWLFIITQINDNEYSEYYISDYYDILIFSGLFLISFLVALSPLNFYSWMEKKFSSKKLISSFFHVVDIAASFIEKTVKLNAVGRAIMELLTILELGGIKPSENPGKWFEAQIVPSWIGAMTVAGLATYIERREKPMFLLGDKEQRKEVVEFNLLLCTAFAINVFYWSNIWYVYENPEDTKANNSLIYFSALSNVILALIPLAILSYLAISSLTSTVGKSIKSFNFRPSLKEPLLDSYISEEASVSPQSSESETSVSLQSSEEEISSEINSSDEDSSNSILSQYQTKRSNFSRLMSKTWKAFFSESNSDARFAVNEDENNTSGCLVM